MIRPSTTNDESDMYGNPLGRIEKIEELKRKIQELEVLGATLTVHHRHEGADTSTSLIRYSADQVGDDGVKRPKAWFMEKDDAELFIKAYNQECGYE